MIDFIYKPKGSRIWRWRFRQTPKEGAVADVSLGTSDTRAAEKRQALLREERQHEEAGLIPSKLVRDGAKRKLADHLEDYLSDKRRHGKAEKYVANLEFRVARLIVECRWDRAKDATADSFQTWLRAQGEMKDKTANDYLDAVQCFFNWMVKFKRFGSNPLLGVEKVKTEDGQTQVRRALGIDEMVKLLAASGDRSLVYLMAVHTGLRRSELGALLWSDLHLDDEAPFLRVRASTTKNGKSAEMRVHPELLAALKAAKPTGASEEDQVFPKVPRVERFRRDLVRAGIALRNAKGHTTDFHSLRKTFGTNLGNSRVPSRVAMTLLRHSDRRLLDKIYTDESLLGTWDAFDLLPNYAEQASQGLCAEGPGESSPVTTAEGPDKEIPPVDIGENHFLSLPVLTGQQKESGGSGGTRTRNLCRDRAAL